ncbi:hypothetical protein WAF17_02485 [Bernardetia sp. ABR2-2B]|uniref:hypothetical protein n=1 Tax=Bernardetia sp. ABR2-2B TaxID=3127472 RepID=UPI0030CB7911
MKSKYLVHKLQMDLNKVVKDSFRIPTDATKITGVSAICNETNDYYKVDLKAIATLSVCLNTEMSAFLRINVPLPSGIIRKKEELENIYLPVNAGDMIEVVATDLLNKKYYCQDAFNSGFSNGFGSIPKFCPDPKYKVTLILRYE